MRELNTPRLSIIIVSYNSRDDLDACLTSLAEERPAVDHEILVVDNASPDGTAAHVRQRWPGIRVIDAGGNVGFARANNIGIGATFGELVLLLNPDTRVPRGAIDRLVAVLDRHPDTAVAGPQIVDGKGRRELSFGPMISPFAEVRQKLLVVGNDRGWPGIPAVVTRLTSRDRVVDWVSGACLLARRADLDAVGRLDERFFLYTEDVDLCAAIRARGRLIRFVSDARIVHLRGRAVASAPVAANAAYRRSQIAFYRKHHPGWMPLLRAYLKLKGEWVDK